MYTSDSRGGFIARDDCDKKDNSKLANVCDTRNFFIHSLSFFEMLFLLFKYLKCKIIWKCNFRIIMEIALIWMCKKSNIIKGEKYIFSFCSFSFISCALSFLYFSL